MRGAVRDLLMERQKRDRRIEGFAGFSSESDDFESRRVDLLRELVDSDVGGCADEDLAWVHLR
jgi:hypothetical protein